MKNDLLFRLKYFLLYFIFWLTFFEVVRILFLVYQFDSLQNCSLPDLLASFVHGFKLDLSSTAYLLVLPFLLMVVRSFFGGKWYSVFMNIYSFLFLFFAISVVIVDIELYKYWGYRLDHTAFNYINTTKEMFASVKIWTILKQLGVGALMLTVFWIAYRKWIAPVIRNLKSGNFTSAGIFIFLFAFLIIPIRGGLGIAPANVGMVFFHKDPFLNHAAINVHWNLGYSFANLNESDNNYKVVPDKQAEDFVNKLDKSDGYVEKVISTEHPNILIIILESFTAKVIGALGNERGITPNINKFANEGILFTNFFATGDRTDKGILGILSGYPSQPTKSIIKFTGKNSKLPNIAYDLKELGYYTSFFYGGTIDFANIRSYLVNSNFSSLVTIDDFDPEYRTSKWGVHDHILLDKVLSDLNNYSEPFFSVVFTLSSHEPFDVPMETFIHGRDEEHRFLNSVYYTDKCLGDFIKAAKKQTWWDSTMVILVADHGVRNPGNSPVYALEKFRIPMIWIGGAVTDGGRKVTKYGSQTDIPQTLFSQLNMNKNYPFSKDLFASESRSFAFYTFNDGWGFVTDTLAQVFDNINHRLIIEEGEGESKIPFQGSVYLQRTYQDFLDK